MEGNRIVSLQWSKSIAGGSWFRADRPKWLSAARPVLSRNWPHQCCIIILKYIIIYIIIYIYNNFYFDNKNLIGAILEFSVRAQSQFISTAKQDTYILLRTVQSVLYTVHRNGSESPNIQLWPTLDARRLVWIYYIVFQWNRCLQK